MKSTPLTINGDTYPCTSWIMTRNRWEYYVLDVPDVPEGCFFAFVMGFEDELGYVSWDEIAPHIMIRLDAEHLVKAVKEATLRPPIAGEWAPHNTHS